MQEPVSVAAVVTSCEWDVDVMWKMLTTPIVDGRTDGNVRGSGFFSFSISRKLVAAPFCDRHFDNTEDISQLR